jgi:hypothetical protein
MISIDLGLYPEPSAIYFGPFRIFGLALTSAIAMVWIFVTVQLILQKRREPLHTVLLNLYIWEIATTLTIIARDLSVDHLKGTPETVIFGFKYTVPILHVLSNYC